MHQNILTLLDALLKIPSVSSDIAELERIISCVEWYFSNDTQAIVKRYVFNEKPSIVIQNFEGFEADIILNGHLDVVPPSDEGQFESYEKDGKIYARGSWDMKSWVALMMVLMKEVIETKFAGKKICLMITTDEELGWEDGVKKLVEFWYTAAECILIPDSGSVAEITIAHKWMIDITVEVRWKSGHSSRPWLGDNAIEKTMDLCRELKNTFEETDKLTSQNEYWGATVAMTQISWGTATNVIPDSVNAHFNIRITETYKDVQKLMTDISNIVQSYDAEISDMKYGSLVHTPEDSAVIQKYLFTAQKTLWLHTIVLNREHWATDGRYFADIWVPVILHRPDTDYIHTKGEYVVKQAIFDIYDVYRAFIFDK